MNTINATMTLLSRAYVSIYAVFTCIRILAYPVLHLHHMHSMDDDDDCD